HLRWRTPEWVGRAAHPHEDRKLFRSSRFAWVTGADVLRQPLSKIPMNHQGVSEISFEETYCVPPEQTARALFSRLPHGSDYAERLIECLATGYLVAVIESICIRGMQQHVDATTEVVVGRTIQLEHKGPIPPGSSLKLRGWVERLGERSATFCVQVSDDHEVVCESSVTLVAAQREPMESRIAAKVGALVASPTGDFVGDARGRCVARALTSVSQGAEISWAGPAAGRGIRAGLSLLRELMQCRTVLQS
ncbi:MAG: hotdog domain-containing protein, partial [Rhodoferax sp.]